MMIELISILALAGLMIGLVHWLKQDMRELNIRMNNLANTLGEIRERLAYLEGLIEGLFRPPPTMSSPDNPYEQNRAA